MLSTEYKSIADKCFANRGSIPIGKTIKISNNKLTVKSLLPSGTTISGKTKDGKGPDVKLIDQSIKDFQDKLYDDYEENINQAIIDCNTKCTDDKCRIYFIDAAISRYETTTSYIRFVKQEMGNKPGRLSGIILLLSMFCLVIC